MAGGAASAAASRASSIASASSLNPRATSFASASMRRFDAMLAEGALEEVRRLAARRLDPSLPAMRAHGVPWLLSHLRGEIGLEEAAEAAKADTRRYARRQFTWFRHQMPGWSWQAPEMAEEPCRRSLRDALGRDTGARAACVRNRVSKDDIGNADHGRLGRHRGRVRAASRRRRRDAHCHGAPPGPARGARRGAAPRAWGARRDHRGGSRATGERRPPRREDDARSASRSPP